MSFLTTHFQISLSNLVVRLLTLLPNSITFFIFSLLSCFKISFWNLVYLVTLFDLFSLFYLLFFLSFYSRQFQASGFEKRLEYLSIRKSSEEYMKADGGYRGDDKEGGKALKKLEVTTTTRVTVKEEESWRIWKCMRGIIWREEGLFLRKFGYLKGGVK